MKTGFTFVLVLLLATFQSSAQFRNVVIDSGDFIFDAAGIDEPSIAIDPKNTHNLIAGSNIDNYYKSIDGGLTWALSTISSTLGVTGDPVLICDTSGGFYYFHLALDRRYMTGYQGFNKIVSQYLAPPLTGTWTDGTFAGLVDTPKTDDKPGVGIDRNTNTLLLCWTKFDEYQYLADSTPGDSSYIMFAKSVDGAPWTTAVRINQNSGNCSDNDQTAEGAIPCAGPDGQIYVGWAYNNAIIFDRSFDGGVHWLDTDKVAATMPNGWDYDIPGISRCNGLPFTACDVSHGVHRGTIYISWSDQRNGANNTDIWIIKSTDSGASWSAPLRVNDDTVVAQQFMSSMTVDQATGYIYVLFYDRRNYVGTATPDVTDVYLATSTDGGATFQNHKISEHPFLPINTFFFGDYTFVAAHNNVIRPIWAEQSFNGLGVTKKIVVGIIDSTILSTPVINANNTAIAEMQIIPNPTDGNGLISVTLAVETPLDITVTDASGRVIKKVVDNQQSRPGTYSFAINEFTGVLQPGIYFVHTRTKNQSLTQKLIFTGH